MTKIISRLGAILGLESKDFVKGVNEAQQKSKEFKKSLREAHQTVADLQTGMTAAGAALVAFGGMAMKTADDISDLADANDTTIGKVLELKHALVASGGDAEKLSQFYSSFTNAIDDAAQGNDKLRDSFAKVGISIRDIANLSGDELQGKAIEGLSKINDAITRNATARALFGKAAKDVDFTQLANQTAAVAGHFDEQAKAIKAAADAADKLAAFFSDMKVAALAAMEPITNLINKLPTEDRIEAMTKAFQILGTTLAVAFGIKAVRGVMALGNAIRVLAVSNPWLLALTAGGAAAAYFGSEMLMGEGPDDQDYPETNSGAGGVKREIGQSQKQKIRAKYDADLDAIRRSFELRSINASREFEQTKAMLDLENQRATLSTNEYNRRTLFLQMAEVHLQKQREYEAAVSDARKELALASADEHELALRNFNEKKRLLDEAYDAELAYDTRIEEMRVRNFEAEVARQRSWIAGWNDAFKQYQESAERASDRGRQAFETVISNMDNALRNFVETGKLNFRDFVGSVIKDLMFMELKAQATSLFGSLFKSSGSFLSSLFAGTGATTTGGFAGGGYGRAASGGFIDSPTLVGENGPELFIPRTPGTVVPNGSWQQMATQGGGTVINGPYIANLSAIDTQSGMQFLAKNKSAVWAAYQSANRSVPISR